MARGGPEELCGHIFWMGNLLLRISRHLSLRHCPLTLKSLTKRPATQTPKRFSRFYLPMSRSPPWPRPSRWP